VPVTFKFFTSIDTLPPPVKGDTTLAHVRPIRGVPIVHATLPGLAHILVAEHQRQPDALHVEGSLISKQLNDEDDEDEAIEEEDDDDGEEAVL